MNDEQARGYLQLVLMVLPDRYDRHCVNPPLLSLHDVIIVEPDLRVVQDVNAAASDGASMIRIASKDFMGSSLLYGETLRGSA